MMRMTEVDPHNDYRVWFQNGKRHREDGPAVERADGTREWWLNGVCHRIDGPAVIRGDGTMEWWLLGEQVTEQQFLMFAET